MSIWLTVSTTEEVVWIHDSTVVVRELSHLYDGLGDHDKLSRDGDILETQQEPARGSYKDHFTKIRATLLLYQLRLWYKIWWHRPKSLGNFSNLNSDIWYVIHIFYLIYKKAVPQPLETRHLFSTDRHRTLHQNNKMKRKWNKYEIKIMRKIQGR